MGNALSNLKKILSNRNTVTILAVLLGVVVLYFAYNMRVKEAIEPVNVPCAKVEINSGTVITEDMIEYVAISKKLIKKSPGIITSDADLIGKRVSDSSSIPVNGLFYTDQLAENSEISSIFKDIQNGFTVFTLKVNFNSTYGNSIYPGNYIDLYVEGDDEDGKLIYTKFIESIKVLAVVDAEGNNVFGGTNSKENEPDALLFAVPDDMFKLLRKAELIGLQIYPIPRNLSYTKNPKATEVASTYVKNLITVKTATIPDEDI